MRNPVKTAKDYIDGAVTGEFLDFETDEEIIAFIYGVRFGALAMATLPSHFTQYDAIKAYGEKVINDLCGQEKRA